MFGLGKPRSKFGKWIDKNGISQQWLVENCGVDKNTTSRLCNDEDYRPNRSTQARVVYGLREEGYKIYEEDFWD
jgi:putative transcriptional regulator